MRQFIAIFLMLTSLRVYSAQSEVSYVCTVEDSVGFIYEKGIWKVSQFDMSKDLFLIRKLKKNDPGFENKKAKPYGVFAFHKKIPDMFCSTYEQTTMFLCSGLGDLKFSSETGRFLRTYPFGYIDSDEDNNISPKIMRGRCSVTKMDDQFRKSMGSDSIDFHHSSFGPE